MFASAAVLAACGSDDAPDRDTDGLVDRVVDLEHAQDLLECECLDEPMPCMPALPSATDVECFKAFAADHAEQVRPELECEVRKTEAENECLRTADCADVDAWEACFESLDCDDGFTESNDEELKACEAAADDAAEAGSGGDGASGGDAGEAGSGVPLGGSSGEAGSGAGAGDEGGAGGAAGSAQGGRAGSAVTGGSGGGTSPAATSPGCDAAEWPASGSYTIDVDGVSRSYVVTVPGSYDPATPFELVLAWHGGGGTANQLAGGANGGYYGLANRAAGSAIFVAGQGLPTEPGDLTTTDWANLDGRDIAFVQALLDRLLGEYCIDGSRVFSVGMSTGGGMSNTVGCELGDVFRAIAVMAGNGPDPQSGCEGQVAVWLSHGNTDGVTSFAAGEASRDFWAMTNHCTAATAPVSPSPCIAFDGCDDGHPVHFCEFDGGHLVPAFAAEGIWSFFSQF